MMEGGGRARCRSDVFVFSPALGGLVCAYTFCHGRNHRLVRWLSCAALENVTIMSGVTVSDGAVIAANSHVVKDVEPYSIVGGNPARHIKYRFSQEQIEKLLKIGWWNWDDEKIQENVPLLCNKYIDMFIEEHDV